MNKTEFSDYLMRYLAKNDQSFQKLSVQEKRSYASSIVDCFFNSITEFLKTRDKIEIRGLGVFKVKEYKNFLVRNPKNKEDRKIVSKHLPTFKPSKLLKQKLIDLANK